MKYKLKLFLFLTFLIFISVLLFLGFNEFFAKKSSPKIDPSKIDLEKCVFIKTSKSSPNIEIDDQLKILREYLLHEMSYRLDSKIMSEYINNEVPGMDKRERVIHQIIDKSNGDKVKLKAELKALNNQL